MIVDSERKWPSNSKANFTQLYLMAFEWYALMPWLWKLKAFDCSKSCNGDKENTFIWENCDIRGGDWRFGDNLIDTHQLP